MFDDPPETLSDDELTSRLVAIHALRTRLDAAELPALAEWERRRVWAADGSHSAAARLARETGMAHATARERVRVAVRLRTAPVVRAALLEGRLGWSKVRTLLGAVNERTAEAFERDERLLVEQAEHLTVEQLQILLRHWQHVVDDDGANADADAMRQRAFLDLAESWCGEGFLTGRLDPVSRAIVKGELDAIAGELHRAEQASAAAAAAAGDAAASPVPSTPSHRRALALVEMARRSAAAGDAAASGAPIAPARPLVVVNLDVERHDGLLDLRGRLHDGTPLTEVDVRQLCCDAGIMRAVTKGGSVPIDLGRTSRDPSEGQRRYLASIWPTCAFPGCDRPYAWTHLHHIRWWDEEQGPTDLDNLLPLCSHHHHECHRHRFRIARPPGGAITFVSAAGGVLGTANPTLPDLLRPLRAAA